MSKPNHNKEHGNKRRNRKKMGNGLDLVEGICQLYNFREKDSDLMAIGEETLWKK